MSGLLDRLQMLTNMRRDNFPILLLNAQDAVKDKNGSASTSIIGSSRFLGVSDFVLSNDVSAFKLGLSEAARIRLSLIERFETGEPISKSYVTMLNYKAIFNALAACEFELAKSIASHIGGRQEIEKEYDHPFDYALGYAVRAFVLNNHTDMARWEKAFASVCQAKENADFQGYARVFQAILSMDSAIAQEGLKMIVKGHEKQSKGNGVFKDSEDEVLCVWGVAIANLARMHGLSVEGVPPLIPNELLC